MTAKQLRDNPSWQPLKRLYALWDECRLPENCLPPKGDMRLPGPLRMEARKRLFLKLLAIQEESGVTLVGAADRKFIEKCWADGVYPRNWSAEDETRG